MHIRHTVASIAGLLLCISLASPASAQSTTLTLAGSAGYLFAKTTGTGGDRMPAGWVAAIEAVYNSRYAGVVELAGSAQGAHVYRTNLGGARFIIPTSNHKLSPFVQLLAGNGRSSATGDGANAFTLQPGAGVDLFGTRHIGMRLQGDYDWRHQPTGNINGFRFAASLVIR